LLKALNETEELLDRPTSVHEVYSYLKMNQQLDTELLNPWTFGCYFLGLHREDLIYADKNIYRFSTRAREGFMSFSEHFRQRYPGYLLDEKIGTVYASSAKVLNAKEHVALLLSKDATLLEMNKDLFDGNSHLCDGAPLDIRVSLTGYVRSGTNYLRRVIEQITGLATGSTTPLSYGTMTQLLICKADLIHDDRVWFKKSHTPILSGGSGPAPPFDCDKLLVIVRNPLDVFYSMHCYCNTMNHAIKPEFEVEKEYPEQWDWFVKQPVPFYKRWFETIYADCKKEGKSL